MGMCTDRRAHILFLTITVFQIILTIARWVIDFLGPMWSMILTDFLNIVFAILGFSGGYAQIKNYLFSYIVWSLLWLAWNIFIICLYIPIPSLEMYKSTVLSLGTGGLSYWETYAPGCEPDWASESKYMPTNCMFDPRLMEFIQAGVQVCLSVTGVVSAFILLCKHDFEDNKSSKESSNSNNKNNATPNTVPAFLSSNRSTIGSRMSSRNRPQLGLPKGAANSGNNGDSSDQVNGNDDRLRPMTPRRVKRRSARSIQSQKFGSAHDRRNNHNHDHQGHHDNERPSTSKGVPSSNNSGRSSLRSNASSRRSHRSSKRKQNHQFISPVNRLMQQVDSETSHEEPGRYTYRDQGHVNPVYVGPQSPSQPPPPPRPPSARSSYSNYHPARLPSATTNNLHPNVFNLNQNIFTNGGFDMSTEYNVSQHSNTTSANLYEDDINFFPDPGAGSHPPGNLSTTTTMALNSPLSPASSAASSKAPNGFAFSFNPHANNNNKINNNNVPHQQPRTDNPAISNQPFAYPLAHSPVSQESFPMWGMSQPQSPVQNHQPSRVPLQSPPYQNPPSFQPRPYARQLQPHPTNSETVI
ncbi:Sodium/potassium-transporting ATPase subunit beta-1-interacting protein [Orchesella cincta]|uniref:Sodium/potassium-transporting ATPase subunit beta-1-interacting protein n=1 Tax=Orchesella cincta TaxID=48709 RepID=A0A1D2NBW0_ORCCI|nr:Sodium/potassium-transporting ATPase subunit beta-1-interacting protein [Orchesella cincta]